MIKYGIQNRSTSRFVSTGNISSEELDALQVNDDYLWNTLEDAKDHVDWMRGMKNYNMTEVPFDIVTFSVMYHRISHKAA